MSLQQRIVRLREAVAEAQPDPSNARPTYVKLIFVGGWGFGRVDIEFEWVLGGERCRVHSSHTDPRRAVREVAAIAEHVRPGRRFRAAMPENWEAWT